VSTRTTACCSHRKHAHNGHTVHLLRGAAARVPGVGSVARVGVTPCYTVGSEHRPVFGTDVHMHVATCTAHSCVGGGGGGGGGAGPRPPPPPPYRVGVGGLGGVHGGVR
jgi:hypothetical protein